MTGTTGRSGTASVSALGAVLLGGAVVLAWAGNAGGPPEARELPASGSGATAPADPWKVEVTSRSPSPDPGARSAGHINVEVQSENGVDLQGVEVTACPGVLGHLGWNTATTGPRGGAFLADHCGPTGTGGTVTVELEHASRTGSFEATTGYVHHVTLKDRRDPVTLEGRLVWRGTGDPVSGSFTVEDDDGNRETLSLGSDGRFSERLPRGFLAGEDIGVDVHQNDIPNLDLPECPPSRDCWTVPGDGDLGTKEINQPEIAFDDVEVRWSTGGGRPDGTVSIAVGGATIGDSRIEDGHATGTLSETGEHIERSRRVTAEFTPSFAPGLVYRKEVQYAPQDYFRLPRIVEFDLTPPEVRVSGGVVDMHEDGKPVKADVAVKDADGNAAATTTSSKTDGSFDLTVGSWVGPISGIDVDPDSDLYPSLRDRSYGRGFWTQNLDALTSARDEAAPTVVAPTEKASFHLDGLALEVSGEMKPAALEGRLRWREQLLFDEVGNRTRGRTHAFHGDDPRGTVEMFDFDATGISIGGLGGGSGSGGSVRSPIGSTTVGGGDDGEFRLEFDSFYTSRTVFFEFTPASASNVTYASDAIRVERGGRIEEEIPHPALDLHGSITDPDGCAIAATIEFHPAVPGDDSWSQDLASSGRRDDRGRTFSGTVEHLPVRKVVIDPAVDYLREKTLTQEEWRELLEDGMTAYDPSEQHEHDLDGRDRPRFLARELDIELDYVRPVPMERPDVDRDGIPRAVERHLARVHRPSYRFDERETSMPGDVESYLQNSRLENTADAAELPDSLPGAGVLDDFTGVPYLHNERETPSPTDWGPAYVRVEKLDAARLEDATYRIAYGLWYDRARNGPFYLPEGRGAAFRGAFRELFVDVRRGEVQQVFLRNYDHDGAGERTVAGLPFDFAASSYTYDVGGTGRTAYDPLVESDELDRLRWEDWGVHEGSRRPQYFRVYVAAGTHNQFLRPGKTFVRPMAITTDSETADAVKRAVFGTSTFVPQVHRGNKSTRFNANVNVVFRPGVTLLTPSRELSEMVGDGGRPAFKPSGGDLSDSFVQFPGYWGQDQVEVPTSDGGSQHVWLSTDGPAPMEYGTVNRLGSGLAPPAGHRVPREEIERIQRRADTGGRLFGAGYGGAGYGADDRADEDDGDDGDGSDDGPGDGSAGAEHLYAWSGDATFQYVVGACLDSGACPTTPGGSGGAPVLPGAGSAGAPDVTPDLGGEVSGFAQKYPASGDAYLDADFWGHAFGARSRFLRVTGLRQTGIGGASMATTVRFDGKLRSFGSLPRGSAYTFDLATAGATFSAFGFEVGTEVSVTAKLNRPTVQGGGGGGQRARVVDGGLYGSWSIVHLGWDADNVGVPMLPPSVSFSPIQAEKKVFGSTLDIEVGPEGLRSWVELSADYELGLGVSSGIGVGPMGIENSFTNFELLDYRVAETRYHLLR